MFKELATIKDGNNVTGFIMYKEPFVSVMSIEQAKKEAAAGNIDTLGYENGKFIPIIQGDIVKEMTRSALRRCKKVNKQMTFDDFVDKDCIFRQQDMDRMMDERNQEKHIVLAMVGNAFELRTPTTINWTLTTAFYSPNNADMQRIRRQLAAYGIKIAKDYTNFIMLDIPLLESETGFDILTFQKKAGVNLLFNLDTIKTLDKRMNFIIQCAPWLARKLLEKAKVTEAGMKMITEKLSAVNCCLEE